MAKVRPRIWKIETKRVSKKKKKTKKLHLNKKKKKQLTEAYEWPEKWDIYERLF